MKSARRFLAIYVLFAFLDCLNLESKNNLIHIKAKAVTCPGGDYPAIQTSESSFHTQKNLHEMFAFSVFFEMLTSLTAYHFRPHSKNPATSERSLCLPPNLPYLQS